MNMYTLDSLSLTRAATEIPTTKQHTTLKTTTVTSLSTSLVLKKENNVENLMSIEITPTTTIKNNSYEMTTNKYKQLQQQQQNPPEPQQQQLQQQQPINEKENIVFEKFMNQITPTTLPHKIKEMIKNNNENLNDEIAMTTIENNTTIADNTMPQEQKQQQQQLKQNNENYNTNENSNATKWGKVPAESNCKCQYNYSDTNTSTTTTTITTTKTPKTTNSNVATTNATNTTTDTTANSNNNNIKSNSNTFKVLNVDNVDSNQKRMEEILLTNIQNNVNLNNTFVLPTTPGAAAPTKTTHKTLQNVNTSGSFCCCYCSSPHDKGMREFACEGMFPPRQITKHSCNLNNNSQCIGATCDNSNGCGGGGSCCHNGNNDSNSNNNNDNILNTNSLVTVECSLLTCENEREQEIRKEIQNGYKNSGNIEAGSTTTNPNTTTTSSTTTTAANNNKNNTMATKTIAEFSANLGEEFYFSPCSDSEKFENPIGNLFDRNVSIFDSPVDSVLENFEKFLNTVRLENQNLNQNVPECNDLIDLSDESMGECDKKDNVIQHKCNKLERNESTCNALLNDKSENINSIENLTKQTCSDSNSNQIHVNNNEKSGNFENLLYCDLNETLEEQNLLESKEILQLTTATATTTAELTKVETAKIIKTLNKVNELERADNKNNENNDEQLIPIQNDNNYNYNNNIKEENNILMVDEVNETITKTPVTCINVYTNTNNSSSNNNNNYNNSSSSNENRNNKNNSQEQQQHETCAVIVPTKETCQNSNSNSCNVKFVTTTAEAATIATTTTQTNRVPLEIVTTKNKIRSSSSIENISPQTQNKIQNQKQKQKESVSIDTTTTAANTTKTATTTSISFLTTNTQTHKPKSIQTANIVEYKNYIHHLEQQQHQQQQEESKTDERIQQDQFTSAYTLRDFAKCLKPSADEDIIYTFNSIQQNQNEKEKLQKFQFNLNSNKQDFNSNESVSSAIKSINFSVKNEKQVNLSEFEEVKVNENNLYNNILKPDNNGINHSPPTTQTTTATTNSYEFENKSELNCENFVENQKLVKLKDTQFLEIENLSTPHFFQNRTKQSGLDSAQKADKNQDHQHQQQPHKGKEEQEKGVEFHHKVSKENIENFDNELKFNCNEKIYTRENNFQPLLYLTFLWPTKNEGQVVTTRRQGNDKQGDNEKEIEKGEQEREEQGEEEQEEVEVEKSQTEKEYRFNRQYNNENYNNNNKNVVGHDDNNVDDECDCNCKFAQRRELEKTYGTCNKKHVEDTQKGRHQILKKEREQQKGISNNDNKNEGNDNDDNNNDDDDGDLCEQRILIDKQKREYKNQCLHKTETKSSENFQKILKNPTNLNKSENCTSALQKNINQINSYEIKENAKENSIVKENFPTSEKCVLQSENCENINDNDRENVIENFKQIKSVAIDINRNNPNLNKTESVYNQDKNIKQEKQQQLNLNKSLKRLNETNQSIQNQIHATYTPTTTNNNNHHHQHQHQHHYHFQHPELIEKSAEDQLNLEEFEASQRLKRLLQQHQQFRIRYDTTIPILSTQFDNYKQNNAITTTAATTTTSESLKTDIARHSKEIPKGNLFISNNNNNNNNQDEGVAHTNTLTTSTTTTTTKTKTTTTKEKLNTITETAPTTATTETKANKLEADCETTLERSSLLLLPQTNEHQQQEYKQGIIAINKNPKEQKKNSNLNLKDKDKEQVQKDNEKEQEIVKRIDENVIKVANNKEINENKSNSPPLAYVSKKIVRLSQQKQHQTHQRSLHNTNPLIEFTSTDKQEQEEQKQQQQQIQQNIVVIEKSTSSSSTLRFPIEKDLNKTEISQKSSPSKLCNINLQHIVKTKQLLQQENQQQQQQVKEEEENCILLERKNSLPTTSDCQLNEYKSAFVPTKPEIYKSIKPLTGTTGNLTAPIATPTTTKLIPLIPVTASLSEFDTQRFSDFLYLNNLTNTLNNNNNNTNTKHQIITHVLPIQQQQQQLYQQYPLYATNYEVDTIELPYCYDELLLTNETQHNFNQNDILNVVSTPLATSEINNNPDHCINDIENDDLISISSTNSSPCDCINCQQQTEQDIDRARDRDRERLFSSTETNVIPVVSLNENEALELTQQQLNKTYKMREVNGQLRGLLKKPNRPPPTRKNRVVFDETRNEFFEADYIILIREDCAYDEEDEEPCTCGEHELVRLCCEEGCQCNYSTAPATTDDNRTPQSPKYAPPIEFVDEAALSPPDGYKDNGLKNTLGGALSGHIFGAQHLQQLQVIQRLQQQRAAMLAARNNSQIPPPPPPATANSASVASVNQQSSTASSTSSSSSPLTSSSSASSSAPPSSTATAVATTVANNNSINQNAATQQHSPDDDTQGVCTECAECAECAAKQLQQDAECNSPQCHDDLTAPLGVPAVALLPIHTSSPERRMTQKEIIAGEERPRYVLQAQYKSSPVSERRIVREATEDLATIATGSPATTATTSAASVTSVTTALSAGGSGGDSDLLPPALPAKPGATSINNDSSDSEKPPPIPPKESSPTTQISGILKGGKLWKQDSISQSDDQNNTTSEDEAGSTSNGTIKRSVRFVTEDISNDEVDGQSSNVDEDNQINELIPIKKHSTLFKNALRPNSAVQQLFPSTASHQTLTSEALRAFDESKRAGCLVSTLPGSAGDSDTLRRSMERNILRRSLIKKKAVKSDISLEERIKQLTCGIDEDNDELGQENGDDDNSKIEDNADLSHRDSPAGEENPQKFTANGNNSDKSFSPNSSVSSSSSGSSAYKKITEIFNRDKKNQEKIMEMEENPIVIIPQECRCPAAPDLGMGVQVPVVHTQIHRTPPRQTEPKRQFLSTLAPLTACVAGNKDDLSSYYTLAAAHHNQAAQNAHAAEYNLAAMMAGEQNTTGVPQSTGDEVRKVAPDVIAGTPGQEQQDELAAFAQQEANRTEKIKKRYGNEPANSKENNKEVNSDDDEGNDYGFNKRPSVRGIKPKFSSTNEILQQMQDQLSQQMPSVAHSQPLPQPMKSYTLPKQASASAMTKQLSQQQPSPQNVPHPIVATSQQQLPQQQQMCSTVAPPAAMQMPANAAIAQQQTEQRTWSFYSETGGAAEQQRLPVESAAAAMQQTYYQTLPAGAMFRHTMIHQHQQHGPEEAMLYAQNCQAMATTIEPQPHYGHYARSPTRRPESPPPLRNYHQTMVLIPYNAETYSQFAATNMDPKVAHIQRQNILEYQQVTQQTIRVPIGYALPGMQLHVVAGRGHAAQYATAAGAQTHHHQHQRIMTQRYQFAQEASMAGFSERGVPEGAAAVSHTDCASSGMVSPTTGQQIAMQQQQQQQLQQGVQMAQQQQQQQQQINCQQQHQQQQQPQPQTQNNMQTAAQGSVYYAMNV